MRYNELEIVKVLKDFPEHDVKKDETGTIVEVFTKPNEAYEVEFVNDDGTTKAMFAIFPENIVKEQIEYNNVSKILIEKFPAIIENPDWFDNGKTLGYIVAADFNQYILKNIKENNIEELKKCFEFIELLYINGTEETKELATIGYLEGLQNITGGNKTMEEYKIFYEFLGTESKKWWNKLNDFWNEKI